MRIVFMVIAVLAALYFIKIIEYQSSSDAKEVTLRQMLPMDVPYERSEAHSCVNGVREKMHMQRLQQNGYLQKAAQAHADYLVLNDEVAHEEIEGHKHFTGVKPKERAFVAGYESGMISENLSTKNKSARDSVNGLFSAIYHRFGFLNPGMDEMGVGVTQDKTTTAKSAFVYVMGNRELNHLCTIKSFHGNGRYIYKICKESEHRIKERAFDQALNTNRRNNPEIIVYPYDGEREVPPAFYEEVPDPLPDYEVSGFPVSVEFNEYFFQQVTLHSFTLLTHEGKVVNDVRLMDKSSDPHRLFTDKQYALFPLKRLAYDTTYHVKIVYETKGKQRSFTWSFHTQKPTDKLHILTQQKEQVTLKSGESHILYFRPLNGHDYLTDIEFPNSVDVSFVDNNTIRVTVNDPDLDNFDIRSGGRVVHVEMD